MWALSPSDYDVERGHQIAQIPEQQECIDIAESFMTNHAWCEMINIPFIADEPDPIIILPYNLEDALRDYNRNQTE